MAKEHIEEHSTLIKTPKQLAAVVLAGFLVPVIGIVLLIQLITGGLKVDMSSPAMSEEAVAKRLKPVGEVTIGEAPPAASGGPAPAARPAAAAPAVAAAATAAGAGERIYNSVCQACHAAGLAGAPKIGDKAAWKARIAQGSATLHEHAIKGIRAMPPKGGAMSASNADIQAAVDYMVGKSK